MERQKEFFRKIHPEQFSDTKIVKVGHLDRNFFSYFLETLTNEGREKEFEEFCRKIAEVEICPNLLPQTGPTGGGDSKVDSETYPVSEVLASTWYYGYGNESATNRWAFAISAKRDWKPKVKSDVAKIIKVNDELNRNYTKIFFMTNQYVSDKKRAETEDELRKQFNIDVRILDKNWLLEKVFSNDNKEIAINSFHLSDSFRDEKQIGAMDLKRLRELEEIEKALKKPTEMKSSKCLAMAKRCITLGRQLELPKDKMVGILERAQSLSEKFGMKVDRAEVIYQYAWTIFWWYPDTTLYYKKYKEYEKLTLDDSNVEQLKNLATLWMNLFSLSHDEELIPIKEHTEILINEHKKYIDDLSRPNASLEARASYQMVRTMLGDDINDILKQYIDIINQSDGNLDFNLYPINKLIMKTPIYKDSPYYSEIFELLLEKIGSQSQDLEMAKMLTRRGIDLIDHPYKAIQYFSRSLNKLFKEESKDDLIFTLVNMASSFEKIGLYWASRNFYMYVFYLCTNQYLKFGELNPALIVSANRLKYVELKFGRIMNSIEFDNLEKISKQLYPEEIDEQQIEDTYDYILGIQMFRVEFSKLSNLESLPDYLLERDLPFSSIALKYELGYYDDEMLDEFNRNKDAFDDFIYKWYNQPAKEQMIGMPWFGFENEVVFTSKILGCQIKVLSPNNALCMEIGSTILASIESFFVTGMQNKLLPLADSIIFNIDYIDDPSFQLRLEIDETRKNQAKIVCSNYSKEDFAGVQEQMQNFLLEVLGYTVSILFPYEKAMGSIEKMIKNENALDRSQTFSNSVFYVLENLGVGVYNYSLETEQYKSYSLLRTEKVPIKNEDLEKNEDVKTEEKLKIHYEEPPKDLNFENTSQENISTSTIINIPLWDKAKWKGINFIGTIQNDIPPILSPVFLDKSGVQIFKEWISEYGSIDKYNKIKIGIIKGINNNNPNWYRVIIGSDPSNDKTITKSTEIISTINRLHTMEAITSENLHRFEKNLSNFPVFIFAPSIMENGVENIKFKKEFAIHKEKKSIFICNAWEITENDFFLSTGIMPFDEPVIPKGINNPFVLKLIENKKRFL